MSSTDRLTDEEIRKVYDFKNIAVVGMSRDPTKAAHFVPKYMIEMGYNIMPVNPSAVEILGRRTYSRVSDIKSQVDIVDVFRPSNDVYPVVEDSLKKPGIRVIWLQEGIQNSDAEKIAHERNIDFVFNRCIMAEHMRLFNNNYWKLRFGYTLVFLKDIFDFLYIYQLFLLPLLDKPELP